jgi:hypothetical protein
MEAMMQGNPLGLKLDDLLICKTDKLGWAKRGDVYKVTLVLGLHEGRETPRIKPLYSKLYANGRQVAAGNNVNPDYWEKL